MFAIAVPAKASAGTTRDKKSSCKIKKITRSYPVIITAKKKSMVYNKNHKKSQKKNFSFPV